jgi:hypothetical protein
MWLLDANMDVHLTGVLAGLGIASETAADRGWKALSNGQLVAAAVASGFDCLLTRDRLLGESASHALRLHSTFAVILVNLPQQCWPEYRQRFLKAWVSSSIVPQPGCLVEWPQSGHITLFK